MNKEKLLILLLIVIFINLGLYSDELILNLTDPDNDDHGAGYIKYPDNRMFTDGIFDITDFRIILLDEMYEFQLTFAGKILPVQHSEFEYKYDLGNEFILPLIHIYIDTDHKVDSGYSETIAGTNVQLNSESAWEKCVVIGALPERYKGYLTVKQPELARRTYFPDKLFQTSEKTKLYARISKTQLGEIDEDWGFSVLVFSQDFSQTAQKNIYIREVNSTASQFNFGGGESDLIKDYDPNVIDMIVPLASKQEFILNSYDKEEKKYAVIPAVYPFSSKIKGDALAGEVKQVTDEKVVINLGSENGIETGTKLMIDSRIVVLAEDVFPQLTIAVFSHNDDWQSVSEGMKARIVKE